MTTEEEFYGSTGAGAPAAKFPTIGTSVGGEILSTKITQQTAMETGDLLFWADGSPKWQNQVIVQTNDRDASIDGDDGSRCIYVKGWMQSAVSEALAEVGAAKPEKGGTLYVTYTADQPSKTKGYHAAKLFSASYTPPAAGVGSSKSSMQYDDESPF